ncbi:IS630-Spn1%2C transposase Orf2 [Streptococcus pneumoniae]|nr:IS630-Spn1%2C transposase Orf2 [Streptococcus pneumoniae]
MIKELYEEVQGTVYKCRNEYYLHLWELSDWDQEGMLCLHELISREEGLVDDIPRLRKYFKTKFRNRILDYIRKQESQKRRYDKEPYEEVGTSDFFEAWFQKFLLPTLTTPSVIIMDNARFHRMGKLELLCEEFGHKLLPLPPYSPEYNPIEKTWAHIKKHLKKVLPSCNTFYEALLSCSCFN